MMKKIKDIFPTEDTIRLVPTEPTVELPPEIKGSKYAFYGSLRKGQFNHGRAGLSKQVFIETVKIPGFVMYSLGAFPMIVRGTALSPRKDSDEITVDLFAIQDPDLERGIHMMEIGAGYERVTIKVKDVDYYIYIFDRVPRGLTEVPGGDWAEYRAGIQKKNSSIW